jgi:hypothetical protein
LPMFPGMSSNQQWRVIEGLTRAVAGIDRARGVPAPPRARTQAA